MQCFRSSESHSSHREYAASRVPDPPCPGSLTRRCVSSRMCTRTLTMLASVSASSLQQFHIFRTGNQELHRFVAHGFAAESAPLCRYSYRYSCKASPSNVCGENEVAHVPVPEQVVREHTLKGSCTNRKEYGDDEREKACGPFSAPFMDRKSELHASIDLVDDIYMHRKIFCNRSLNMKSIVAVGFDMDYTLAQYRPETFEALAYHGTIKKLVYDLGYPDELLNWKFDWQYMVRGLVVDKKRGNILKMDRHKYVKVAYHGFQEISRDDRMATYCNTLTRESYDEPDYALIDTLFSLAEAYLFAQLVEFKDNNPHRKLPSNDYYSMYKDVRAAVDLCHRDGTLKQAVADEPSKYIYFDRELIPMLKMLRNCGRMTFLVTNSLWDYTNVVMNYLFGKCGTREDADRDHEWLQRFDVVLTGSAKPSFFADGNQASLYEVDINTGMLQNTDNGSPLPQIGVQNIDPYTPIRISDKQACRVFQGGNVGHLHSLLGIEAGAQVLYVGDHIYGDILRSKKELGWRTMLVVPELNKELQLFNETIVIRKEFRQLRHKRELLDDKIQWIEWSLRFTSHTDEEQQKLKLEMEALQIERDKIRESHRNLQRVCHQKFHRVWGQLMKTGYQNSRFAHQVERFACLYTSRVTNLCCYSPEKSFKTHEDFMPHEFEEIEI